MSDAESCFLVMMNPNPKPKFPKFSKLPKFPKFPKFSKLPKLPKFPNPNPHFRWKDR